MTPTPTTSLRVGLIGASPTRGWAKISHLPAVQQLAGVELAAVVSRGLGPAAAAAFGAKAAYATAADLFQDPNVDLVTICVKVPDHRALVLGALAAGKHVYCEWPLGRDVAEAEEMRAAAAAAGVHVAIGLQARLNPALRRARALVADGAIGRVLSARMFSGTMAFGPRMGEADAYLDDPANGATHLAIHGGHALDAAVAVLGGIQGVAALAAIQYPTVEVEGQGRTYQRVSPDYVLTQSHLLVPGVVAVEVAGGRPPDTTFRFEVVGETGVLVLDGAAPRGFQSGRLALTVNGQSQAVEEGELAQLSDAAYNVGALYAALRDDIAGGRATVPDFAHAVQLTRLVADVERAAAAGTRLAADRWPTERAT